MPAILFVCLGNICRSPLAEAAFRTELERAGLDWQVDSAGTGDWHVGHPPDKRAQAEALRHGVDISGYRARTMKPADFTDFSHIVAMDHSNLANLVAMQPHGAGASLSLMLDYFSGREGESVADPYYGTAKDFARTWTEVSAAAEGLLAHLRASY